MFKIPVLRWGQVYESLDTEEIVHFATGEPIAKIGVANAGLVQRDLKKQQRARDVLREIPIAKLMEICGKAADLYQNATLPIGDGTQSPDEFVRHQSATTGLPEKLCRFNMQKNAFVLANMKQILEALTRGLDLDVLTRGHGMERDIPISFQCQSPVIGMVLPSNSPGVHALWLPVLAMQVGLVLKPGSQEVWTPYRIAEAFYQAGIPREAISLYAGGHDLGPAILAGCARSVIFGGAQTIEQHRGNPKVQVHGPGYSKVLIGEDEIDNWEKYIDVLVDSVAVNSGRSCINASGIWVPRHGQKIADAIAQRLAKIKVLPPEDPNAELAAFTVPGAAEAINDMIDADVKTPGVVDFTARHRTESRLVKQERCAYLLPTVLYCPSPEPAAANREFMFPFVSVVECPQEKMISSIGPTLVGTAITNDAKFRQSLIEATHIDRLNLGPIPTSKVNWLQPHEGNIVSFLFRQRAFQQA